jgi:type IV secretion system protein VirB10
VSGAAPEPTVAMRPAPVVAGHAQLSSRLRQSAVIVLLLVLGAALLGWYYARALTRSRRAPESTRAPLPELVLPRLLLADSVQAAPPAATSNPSVTEVSDTPEPTDANPALRRAVTARVASAPIARSASADSSSTSPVLLKAAPVGQTTGASPHTPESDDAGGGTIAHWLVPSSFAPTSAMRMGGASLVLPKGSSISCTLETAIDSQLPGLVSCITATDVYGADGSRVLLGRGTKLFGETRSDVRSGQARVFVLWTEARTPTGVVVPIASPATDAQGRSGISGSVDTHFFDRFGAAMLISVLDASVQSAASRGGTTLVFAPQASEGVLTEVLRSTVAIPPTIRVAAGARVAVLVAHDVDFAAAMRVSAP